MKYRTKTVNITTVEIVDESRLNLYEPKADASAKADRKYKYTVDLCRESFKAFSQNQKFSVGGRVSAIFCGGKCELTYDSIFYTLSPFTIDNPVASVGFFNCENITELSDLPFYILKKGLCREKRRRGNPADITVDYENLKPFSFEPIPYIPMPEE